MVLLCSLYSLGDEWPIFFLRSIAEGCLLPCIIAARINTQTTAHHPNRIMQMMLCNKRVSHLLSLAKYPRPLIKDYVIAVYGHLALPLFATLGKRHNFCRLTTSNSVIYTGRIGGWRQKTDTCAFRSRCAGVSTSDRQPVHRGWLIHYSDRGS